VALAFRVVTVTFTLGCAVFVLSFVRFIRFFQLRQIFVKVLGVDVSVLSELDAEEAIELCGEFATRLLGSPLLFDA
jgi:hypothetical protein